MYYEYKDNMIIAVSSEYQQNKQQMFDERNIPLENAVLIDGQLYDNRELEYWKLAKTKELENYLDNAESAPYKLKNGWLADCNQKSKVNLSDADVLYHKSWYNLPLIFVDYSNESHTVTLAQWDAIFAELSIEFARRYNLKQTVRTAINEAKTIEEVQAIVI